MCVCSEGCNGPLMFKCLALVPQVPKETLAQLGHQALREPLDLVEVLDSLVQKVPLFTPFHLPPD